MLALVVASSCSTAERGAAILHGTLNQGTVWEASFELTTQARVHGAGPVRIDLFESEAPEAGPLGPGRAIELTLPGGPESGRFEFGVEGGPSAEARSIAPGRRDLEGGEVDGNHVRFPDGSFTARPVSGWLELQLEGTQPGAGATGQFLLEFQTGEQVHGTFAAALAD